MAPFAAALQGAREVGFTVLSMSLSLIAVFIPILLMGGIVGRLFREFAVTLSVAILISLVVSLTTTPMMCARLLRPTRERRPGRVGALERARLRRAARGYRSEPRAGPAPRRRRDAGAARDGRASTSTSTSIDPEGLLPAAGHRAARRRHPGRPEHLVPGDAAEARRLHGASSAPTRRSRTSSASPAARSATPGFMFVALKPLAERKETADQVIARLRGKLAQGARRQPVPAAGAGHPHRRPAEQRAVPVHAAGATTSPSCAPGSRRSARRCRDAARARRRQHRPAGQGPADLARDRPRRRVAPRRHAAA